MAMTAESSPRAAVDGGGSPHSRRSLPSPWAQVVRGEPEAISTVSLSPPPPSSPSLPSVVTEQANFSDYSGPRSQSLSPRDSAAAASQLESLDSSSNGNVGRPKKVAWNKPLNGVVEGGPVMGAVSWPALSECTRPSPKSSSDSPKPISDGSVSISQGPVISLSPPKQANANVNANSNPKFTPNHTQPVRQRSGKRGGGTGGGSAQSGFNRPPPPSLPPPFPVFEIPYGNLVPAVLDSSVREPSYKGNWETRPMGGVGSQSHAVNDHSSQRNSFRRGNFGHRPRGNGIYHNGYGVRRDQDRDWNAPRNSTAREVHVQHQMVPPPRGFIRPPPPPPPPGSTPFITPQHARPFGNPMGFDMASPFFYVPAMPPDFRGVPLIAQGPPPPPPPPMFFPVTDPPLPTLLIKQIDYYFSDANLVKDDYLRSNMDDQGWVPITLIANFPRVQHLTNSIQLILDSLRASIVVEVQGDKLRRRNDWRKWIPSSVDGSTDNMLATSFQKAALDNDVATTNIKSAMDTVDAQRGVVPTGFSSEGLSGQSIVLANGGEGTADEACSSHI